MNVTRRGILRTTLAVLVAARWPRLPAAVAAEELKVPDTVPVDKFDFEAKGIEGWMTVDGRWAVEDMAGAPSGKKVLVQRATKNEFNAIVAPPGPYTDVDVSMRFKPISGQEDASGGIVFRFTDGKYYVVRANALKDNFRLYYYDRGRRQLATASVKAPALGQWHTVRVVAVGDRMQAWLDDKLYLDHRDTRFKINVVAIHNHVVLEEPRFVFLHYWGKGTTRDLARGVRDALDETGSTNVGDHSCCAHE